MNVALDLTLRASTRVAAYIVHDQQTGQVAYHEVFSVLEADEDALADAMIRRWEWLVTEFHVPRYDIEYGIFDTLRAFYEAFPGLAPD